MGLLKGDSTGSSMSSSSMSASSGGFNAILDRGSEFEGKLSFEGTVRIDGKFKGEITSDANLVVGESGIVEADITIGTITISGQVNGNITAKKKVEIHAPATVKGNIKTPSLVIEEGVTFEGQCVMEKGGASSASKPKPDMMSGGSSSTPSGGSKTGSMARA